MKLNTKRTFFVGFAFLSICAFWQLYDSVVPLILKNSFGLGDTVSGAVMAADNILALVMLPLFGSLSDKVHTPLGKRLPFVICGTFIATISMNLLPIADNKGNFILFMGALIVTLFAMATYRSPAVALMSDVTPKQLRSKANAIINLMGTVGGIYSLVLIMFFMPSSGKVDYTIFFGFVSGLMVLAVCILLLTVKENKFVSEREEIEKLYPTQDDIEIMESIENKSGLPREIRKSLIRILLCIFFFFMAYNAVTTAFSKYVQSFLGLQGGGFAANLMIATVAATLAYIPIGILSSKIGRKKAILLGIAVMAVSFTVAAFYRSYHASLIVILCLMGMGYASIIVNTLPMVVEMSKGSDIGKYTGIYYTFSMSAQILTPIVSGAFLEYIGYATLFPYAVVALIISFIFMSGVKHGDSTPEVKKNALEMLDVDD